jgi:deazaflavin-dependent oxidoreductase (nitroreductase family)
VAYLRPNAVTRKVFNPLAMRFGVSGTCRLAVAGRRTGLPRSVPVIPVRHDGARYVVSTRGEADWVRNLRVSGEADLRCRGQAERVRATEVPVGQRPPILSAYRTTAGRAVAGYFTKLPDPADHPVFRVEPAGPSPGG